MRQESHAGECGGGCGGIEGCGHDQEEGHGHRHSPGHAHGGGGTVESGFSVAWLPLLAWIMSITYLVAAGETTQFLRGDLVFLLVAGLAGMTFFYVCFLFPPPSGGCGHGCDHPTGYTFAELGVLAIPLLYVFSAPTQGLGTHAMEKRMTLIDLSEIRKLPPVQLWEDDGVPQGEGKEINIRDLVMAGNVWDGKVVTTEGMVYRDDTLGDDRLLLFRFLMTCCAADAFPVGVVVERKDLGDYVNDTWLRVTGVAEIRIYGEQKKLFIRPRVISPIERPANPYLLMKLLPDIEP